MKPLFLALMMAFMAPTMASAHVRLVSSTPADGALLEASPKTITLKFSQAARIISITLVNAKDEKTTATGIPKKLVEAAVVDIPTLAAGDYVVTWRGASKDMHAMSGTFKFTVK